jgi:DNA-directed RNA polymerase subunit RPC12/RpoP
MLEKSGYKCSKCGWDKINPITKKTPLQVNHIDGDSKSSTEKNLEVLCPNCHSLTPNFGNLNKGNGRVKRREVMRRGSMSKVARSVCSAPATSSILVTSTKFPSGDV